MLKYEALPWKVKFYVEASLFKLMFTAQVPFYYFFIKNLNITLFIHDLLPSAWMPSPKLDNIAYKSRKFKLSWLQLLFRFHCKHSSGDTLSEWHSTIFSEVESSWRWTLLHDVLSRRFLEIYNFRNWSATHGCVYENIELHRRSAEEKRNDYKFGWSFETSFSLLFTCKLLALLHLHVEASLASG